jgi:8-oxo-dGTP pyrophosphatase MutT (NUDIX family)
MSMHHVPGASSPELENMLKALLRQAQSGLHDPTERARIAERWPFEIDGKIAGTLTEDTARFLERAVPGLNLDQGCLIMSPQCSKDSVPVLEKIAIALRDDRRLPRWRNELLAVMADDGTALGVIERAAMRPLGLHMAATHLVGLRSDGRYWLQQRALDKDTDPGLWDTLAGGLVGTEVVNGVRQRESLRLATQRESWEEAGIPASLLGQMKSLVTSRINRMVNEGHMVQDNFAFLATLPLEFEPKNLDGEVEKFGHFSQTEIIALIAEGQLALEPAIIMLQWFTREA